MKEFNIEKAKEGAPVCTREGYPVRIICWDAEITYKDRKYPIIAIVGTGDKNYPTTVESYDEEGRCASSEESPEDLFMAPVKREGWINIYKLGAGQRESGGRIWKDKVSAQDVTQDNESYIATVKIEWEE